MPTPHRSDDAADEDLELPPLDGSSDKEAEDEAIGDADDDDDLGAVKRGDEDEEN